ncbi:hypothetical protein [Puia dinghuensis]|uniref:Uncharacterized protein n=1 Tax=Puia dinghuensis TaxID=1792502 RepID=A0A8J2XWL8_9BACT|nr:hypothetical protein [Puia dinghuensis]GGB24612.1 hypothetical protein GCM10011511_55680 [Puia dinghuensis]
MEDQQTFSASNSLDNFFNIAFDTTTRAQIKQAAVWAKVCTLCAFIGYGVALVVAIFGNRVLSTDTEEAVQISASFRTGNIIGVIITSGIGAIINFFLYRFAVATARGMDSMDSIKTNEGFNSLRIYFKIYGILLIIGLSLAVLAVLFTIIAAPGRL